MTKITEKTLIPISLVVIIISTTIWVTVLAQDTKANTGSIEKIEKKQDQLEKEIILTQKQMIRDLTEIKTKLRIKSQ